MADLLGRMQLSVYDLNGNRGSFLSHLLVAEGETLTLVNAAIAAFAANFSSVSDAGIYDGSFTVVNRGIAADPGADANLPTGAVVDFKNASVPSIFGLYIPSLKDSIPHVGEAIPIDAGLMLAFVDFMRNSGGTNYKWANTQYRPNTAGVDAFRSDRHGR